MVTSCDVYVNHTLDDNSRIVDPTDFIQMVLADDKLIFSAGSAAVIDGADTPDNTELNEAATLIAISEVEMAHTFLLDVSDVGQELKEIHMANSGDYQYVICFAFDGATASEPTFEAWDTDAHATANLNCLGSGTPGDSMLKAVVTTGGSPGPSWPGASIAGGIAPNILGLNGGSPLGGPADIYINIHWDIPASYPTAFAEIPVLAVRYTFI